MIQNIFWKLLIMLSVLSSSFLYAQTNCADKYENISFECVSSFTKKMKSKKMNLSTLEKGEIYFYETSNKSVGKFKVKAVYAGKDECLIYIDPVTYERSQTHKPADYLEIRKNFNQWSSYNANFDTTDLMSDLSLYYDKDEKKCMLSTDNASIYKHDLVEENLVTDNSVLYYAALILIGLSAYFIARNVFSEEERFKASENLEDSNNDDTVKRDLGIVVKYSKPFFKRYFSPIVENMKSKKKIREKYKRKLATAGLTKEMSAEDFYAFKLFLIIGFPIVFFALRYFLEETWPMSLVPLLSLVGYYYPEIWVNSTIQKRKDEVLMGMPFIVDMLALSVEAGLDFVAAMGKVIEKAPPSALVEEFEQMIREIRIGSSRAEALRQLAWRTDVLAVSSFTATLIAADSVGASIGPILKTLANELRQKRSSEAEKKGATAATKILIPMMMFVLPAVLLVIMAPIGMQMMSGK